MQIKSCERFVQFLRDEVRLKNPTTQVLLLRLQASLVLAGEFRFIEPSGSRVGILLWSVLRIIVYVKDLNMDVMRSECHQLRTSCGKRKRNGCRRWVEFWCEWITGGYRPLALPVAPTRCGVLFEH